MHRKQRKDVTSAVSARSVGRAKGVGRVRALHRVFYRCARRDRDRRLQALYDKVARSDGLWGAWGEVRANRGAPGVDGITIDDVVRSGVGDFLDQLAEPLRAELPATAAQAGVDPHAGQARPARAARHSRRGTAACPFSPDRATAMSARTHAAGAVTDTRRQVSRRL
jgi:hypothetical protein